MCSTVALEYSLYTTYSLCQSNWIVVANMTHNKVYIHVAIWLFCFYAVSSKNGQP